MIDTARPRRSAADVAVPSRRPAPTSVDIHPLIAARWSPRAFSDEPVDPERLRAVLEAARWAPSSYNEQPWRFLVATREEPGWLERLGSYLKPGNAWALGAPVLVASAYSTTFTRNGRENRMALRDLGAAEQNAALEAVHQGLLVHQMAGFDAERLEAELLPDGVRAGSMWAVGRPGLPSEVAVEKRRHETERSRTPLTGVVSGPEWGSPPAFLD